MNACGILEAGIISLRSIQMIFVTAAIVLLLAWKYGDWEKWIQYYPTYLYLLVGDLTYNVLFSDHLFWKYNVSFFNHVSCDLFVAWTIYPATILLFLPNWPDNQFMGFWRIVKWVFFYTVVEWIFCKVGLLSYHNGWNFTFSIMFCFLMFFMLRLHYTKPLLTWFISLTLFIASQVIWLY